MIKTLFKKYAVLFQRFTGNYELVKISAIQQVAEYERLAAEMRVSQPDNPALSGRKIYSQTDEDGIIEEIFRRIPNDKTFLEIGIESGKECNTLMLLLSGWKGTWVEGSKTYFEQIVADLGSDRFAGRLNVMNRFVDTSNITGIFQSANAFLKTTEIDFFSLDIDGNDFYIVERLFADGIFPKVVCVEYNAKFPPPLKFTIRYNPEQQWDYSDYMGCSLQQYADLFTANGYTLVCCNIPGINAFFVRNEFADRFASYPVKELYQPYRFYLSPIVLAQKPSLKYLRDQLDAESGGVKQP